GGWRAAHHLDHHRRRSSRAAPEERPDRRRADQVHRSDDHPSGLAGFNFSQDSPIRTTRAYRRAHSFDSNGLLRFNRLTDFLADGANVRLSSLLCLITALVFCSLCFPAAHAQVSAAISGRVSDPTDAVIQGAKVSATSNETG